MRTIRKTQIGATFVFASVLVPLQLLSAQQQAQKNTYDIAQNRQLTKENAAQLSPGMAVLDAGSKTVQFTLTNPTNAPLKVALRVQYSTVNTDSTGAYIAQIDSNPSPKAPTLVGWIKGLPDSISLGPNQTDTIVVSVDVPKRLPLKSNEALEYWGRIVAISPAVQRESRVITRQVLTGADGKPLTIQQPAIGNITFPMASSALLVYRAIPVDKHSVSALKLGAAQATLEPDGEIKICAPLDWDGNRYLAARARLKLSSSGSPDTVVRVVNFDLTPGSPKSMKPCFKGPIPLQLTGTLTATLLIDSERSVAKELRVGQFSGVQSVASVNRPSSNTRFVELATPTTANAGQGAGVHERVPLFEVLPQDGPLHDLLKREYDIAASEGKVVLVEIGAGWCMPCHAFIRSLTDSVMVDALKDARLVRIDFDQWGQSFINGLFVPPKMLPTFFIVKPDGTASSPFDNGLWTEAAKQAGLTGKVMAPGLKEFVNAARDASRKSSSILPSELPRTD